MADDSLSQSPCRVLGFTGHRHIRNEDKVSKVLREVITFLRDENDGEIIGRSSVASGGDVLFAEACLASSLKWIAQLPFPEEEFKKDFSEKDWARAKALLNQALRVEVFSAKAQRPADYLKCGLATVEGADVMIALWDGKASRGTGGTGEIVAHARSLQRPLVLIHAHSLEVKHERFLGT
ncbi:MAG: hypothetical protein QOH88_2670 [Verrucomicrobiota bacterium]|jgi:hypothetical protein